MTVRLTRGFAPGRLLACAILCSAGLLTMVTMAPRGSAHAATQPPEIPSGMPATPFPEWKGCSSSQEAHLKEAWRQAHYYTWRTDRLLDHIMSRPEDERAALWSRDYVASATTSPSPRAWFGPYNRERAAIARTAVDKALRRFEMRGQNVRGIRTVRCGRPIAPKRDVNVDECPSSNPGSSGPPSAYHFPVGTVVTCEKFWDRVKSTDAPADAVESSARTLVHEVFHWLSVDGRYVTDYHGDGAKGHPDQKYYGVANAMYLAQQKQAWAVHNNENYAWFIRYVGAYEPTFSAVFTPKEGAGTGGMYVDQDWDHLVERWKGLGKGQYLADVETYIKDGERRYTAVWRVGDGNGALWASPWAEFEKQWLTLKKTQDLIDVEIYRSGATWMYLGVFRHKQGTTGDGGLYTGLTWDEVLEKRKQFGDKAYLADLETYEEGGRRKFVAVWRLGRGNGALYWFLRAADFNAKKKELNGSQQLIDYEQFISADGKWNYIGVWRSGAPSDDLLQNLTVTKLIQDWQKRSPAATLVDVEEYTALPARVK